MNVLHFLSAAIYIYIHAVPRNKKYVDAVQFQERTKDLWRAYVLLSSTVLPALRSHFLS